MSYPVIIKSTLAGDLRDSRDSIRETQNEKHAAEEMRR